MERRCLASIVGVATISAIIDHGSGVKRRGLYPGVAARVRERGIADGRQRIPRGPRSIGEAVPGIAEIAEVQVRAAAENSAQLPLRLLIAAGEE